MEEMPQNTTPDTSMPTQTTTAAPVGAPEEKRGSVGFGTGVAILVVLAALVGGGIYYWSMLPIPSASDLSLQKPESGSATSANSDEIGALEAELKADMPGTDDDLRGIDQAFASGT
jgi:uncharacterized protein HemX